MLGIAGKLLRDARAAASTGVGPPVDAELESQLIIRAVRVTTLPKLTFTDGRRFAELLNDVYPGVKVTDVSDAELEGAIRLVLAEKTLRRRTLASGEGSSAAHRVLAAHWHHHRRPVRLGQVHAMANSRRGVQETRPPG